MRGGSGAKPASSSSSSAATERRLAGLRSKVSAHRAAEAELTSRNASLEGTNADLQTQIEGLKRDASDAAVEAERARRRHENLKMDFASLEDSYRTYVSKSTTERKAMEKKAEELRKRCQTLEDSTAREEAREMEEARADYAKMAQRLHDARRRTAKLEGELERTGREQDAEREASKLRTARLERELERAEREREASRFARLARDRKRKGARGSNGGGATKASNARGPLDVARREAIARLDDGSPSDSEGEEDVPSRAVQHPANDSKAARTVAASAVGPASAAASAAVAQRGGNRAMEALDRASARRLQSRLHRSSSEARSSSSRGGRGRVGVVSEVRLMMRTRPPPKKKQRKGLVGSAGASGAGVENVDGQLGTGGGGSGVQELGGRKRPPELSSSSVVDRPRTINRVSASQREGTISSFFRPAS